MVTFLTRMSLCRKKDSLRVSLGWWAFLFVLYFNGQVGRIDGVRNERLGGRVHAFCCFYMHMSCHYEMVD